MDYISIHHRREVGLQFFSTVYCADLFNQKIENASGFLHNNDGKNIDTTWMKNCTNATN